MSQNKTSDVSFGQMWKWIWILWLSWPLYAWDLSPEYQGFAEGDVRQQLRPQDIHSEYQSIWNANQLPLTWSEKWSEQESIFHYGVGSISNAYFLLAVHAKFSAQLSEALQFRLLHLQQKDFESEQERTVLQLTQQLGPMWSVALYGAPAYHKRENDIGLALNWFNQRRWSSRWYYTLHDFTRNDHNDAADYFARGRSPHSMGWQGEFHGPSWWGQMGWRYDRPVKWVVPQTNEVWHYHKRLLFADGQVYLSESTALWVRAQWDDVLKEQAPDDDTSAVVNEGWRLRRGLLQMGWRWGHEDRPWQLSPQISFAYREWTNHNGKKMSSFYELPGFSARWRGLRRGEQFDHIQLSSEMTFYQKQDPEALTSVDHQDQVMEARVQTAYEFSFRHSATLLLALNFDLDEWRTLPTFEGGSGQFRTEF